MKKIAIIIMLTGLLLTIFSAFTFFTKEKVAKIGSVKITRNIPHHLSWSPLAGIALMGIGGIAYWLTYKKQ